MSESLTPSSRASPIRRIYTNGIWEVGRKHSRSWRLTDVNYIAASDEPQHNIFKSYCAALNSLPTDVTAKITIVNHRLNPAEFERRILLPYKDDWLDHYREEANAIMLGAGGAEQQPGAGALL